MAGIFDGLNLKDSAKAFNNNTTTLVSKVREGVLNPTDVTSRNLESGVALKRGTDTSVKDQITSYRSEIVEQLNGIIGALSGGLLNSTDLTKAIKVDPVNGAYFSTDSILAAASKELGYPVSGKNSAMQKLGQSISNEFSALVGVGLPTLIQGKEGEGFRVNQNWRTLVGQETLKQISQFTGINQFVDYSVQTAMYNTMMKNAAEYGMKDSYRSIYKLYKASQSGESIMLDSLRTMITNGDIESIDEVLKIIDEKTVAMVISVYPNFIESLFRSFTFDNDVFAEDYDSIRTRLLAVIAKVVGDNWWMKYTEFGLAYDLSIIQRASPDLITLLQPVSYLAPLLCTAGLFIDQSAVTTLKRSFPDAPVSGL